MLESMLVTIEQCCGWGLDDKGIVHGSVCPKLIPMNDSLYGISDATNALKITSSILGDTTVVGAGAGKIETGFALYNDIISIVNG